MIKFQKGTTFREGTSLREGITFCAGFFLCLLGTTSMLAAQKQTPPSKPPCPLLKGSIVAHELAAVPRFKIYYKGIHTISDDSGFFTLPLEKGKENTYSLLICKDFSPTFESINTIKNLALNPKKKYRYFRFTKATMQLLQEEMDMLEKKIKPFNMRLRLIERQITRQKKYLTYFSKKKRTKIVRRKIVRFKKNLTSLRKRKLKLTGSLNKTQKKITKFKQKYLAFQNATPEKPVGDFWFIKEMRLNKKNPIVPKDSVIVCLNPKTVDTVANWSFALSPNFVAFPRIILKDNLETRNIKRKQSITRSALKAELQSLEKQVFHETKKDEYKYDEKQPGVRVSLLR